MCHDLRGVGRAGRLRQPSGSVYPEVSDPVVADPEAVRVDREIRPDGTHVREFTLPPMFRMSSSETGPRGSAVSEGLAITPNGSRVAVMAEGTLFQDGAAPGNAAGSVSRVRHAYPLERAQAEPSPAGSFSLNGATEMLALSDTRNASHVLNTSVLTAGSYTPVTKRLVLDFNTIRAQLGGAVANLEGTAFSPCLPNGNASLVVVADDNFPAADSPTDFNQFLVFEVLP